MRICSQVTVPKRQCAYFAVMKLTNLAPSTLEYWLNHDKKYNAGSAWSTVVDNTAFQQLHHQIFRRTLRIMGVNGKDRYLHK